MDWIKWGGESFEKEKKTRKEENLFRAVAEETTPISSHKKKKMIGM